MNCFNHPDQIAVATCIDCGKGLCCNCASSYSISICNSCNANRIRRESWKIIEELLLTFTFGAIFTYFYMGYSHNIMHEIQAGSFSYIMAFYGFAGVYAGWKTLNRITPRMFLFLSFIGWVIYFFIKSVLSFFVGLVMLPVRTFRNVMRLIQLIRIKI